jgi:hypothetical protein
MNATPFHAILLRDRAQRRKQRENRGGGVRDIYNPTKCNFVFEIFIDSGREFEGRGQRRWGRGGTPFLFTFSQRVDGSIRCPRHGAEHLSLSP